ncbi:hypothetical protein GCM10009664_59530 [Kitasatospora gansuensis]
MWGSWVSTTSFQCIGVEVMIGILGTHADNGGSAAPSGFRGRPTLRQAFGLRSIWVGSERE